MQFLPKETKSTLINQTFYKEYCIWNMMKRQFNIQHDYSDSCLIFVEWRSWFWALMGRSLFDFLGRGDRDVFGCWWGDRCLIFCWGDRGVLSFERGDRWLIFWGGDRDFGWWGGDRCLFFCVGAIVMFWVFWGAIMMFLGWGGDRDFEVLMGRSLFDFFGGAIVILGLMGRSLFDFFEGAIAV